MDHILLPLEARLAATHEDPMGQCRKPHLSLVLSELTHVKRMLWTKYSCFSDLRFFCFVSLWVEGGKRMDWLPHQVVSKALKEDGTPLAPLSLFCLAAE